VKVLLVIFLVANVMLLMNVTYRWEVKMIRWTNFFTYTVMTILATLFWYEIIKKLIDLNIF